MDVVIVGAGPAGLACAIELARLAKQDAGGGRRHRPSSTSPCWRRRERWASTTSPAPWSIRAPSASSSPTSAPATSPSASPCAGEAVYFMTEGRAQRIPTPPTMHNAGFYTASHLRDRALAGRAGRGGWASTCSPGFPVDALLVEGDAVRGVRTTPVRPRPRRPADGRLRRADRPHRPRSRCSPRGRAGC